MARAAVERLGPRVVRGLVIGGAGAHLEPGEAPGLEFIEAGHPLPTAESERAGRRALALAASVAGDETFLVFLSGGASSLMAVPAADLTIEDKRETTERLLKAGADIVALNTVRKHMSAIKGGRLAAGVRGRSVTFAISDVVGGDPSHIASGPTVPDSSTAQDALDLLNAHGGVGMYPRAVVKYLRRVVAGEIDDSPKPGDVRLARATSRVIGSGRDAVDGAASEARLRGYDTTVLQTPVVGEARVAARDHLGGVAACAASLRRPACIISAGETTVRVVGRGTGGRNQEFALGALSAMTVLGTSAVLASVGTDGVDGPTAAAGAIIDSTSLDRARALGLPSPEWFLADNNAHAFFAATGDLIHTGPTDTNVGDLQVVLLGRERE